jgi:mono/diheme cytochrome c family protein
MMQFYRSAVLAGLGLLLAAGIGHAAMNHGPGAMPAQTITAKRQVPFQYGVGFSQYQKNCASCHGEWARGTDQGPPLMHSYYVPSHHGDGAFYRAIDQGVQAHHWRFGDMPKPEDVTQRDAKKIVEFVRWLQQAEGLY